MINLEIDKSSDDRCQFFVSVATDNPALPVDEVEVRHWVPTKDSIFKRLFRVVLNFELPSVSQCLPRPRSYLLEQR